MNVALRPERISSCAGWGDPYLRDPQQVLEDVLDEYVSRAAAEREYGVALTGDAASADLAVDEAGTRRLRARGGD